MAAVEFIDLTAEIQDTPQGFSVFPFRGRAADPAALIQGFHLISIEPGQTRGNHVHPGAREWLYPFRGTGIFRWEASPGYVEARELSGHRVLLSIAPGTAHALTNPGPEVLYLFAWREPVSPAAQEPETVPRPLV